MTDVIDRENECICLVGNKAKRSAGGSLIPKIETKKSIWEQIKHVFDKKTIADLWSLNKLHWPIFYQPDDETAYLSLIKIVWI